MTKESKRSLGLGLSLVLGCGDAGGGSTGETGAGPTTGTASTGGSTGASTGPGEVTGVTPTTSDGSGDASTSSDATTSPVTGTSTTATTTTEPGTSGEGSSTGEPLPDGLRGFHFKNRCDFTVWVGTIGNPIAPKKDCQGDGDCGADQTCDPGNKLCTWIAPDGGGWEMPADAEHEVVLPPAWGGRFWPRTGCANFNEMGVPACETGDCGGHQQCPTGVGGSPPATLAEFTLIPPEQPVGLDFYDVSAVDGANVPVRIAAVPKTFVKEPPPGANVTYYCGSPGDVVAHGALAACPWDLQAKCPKELQVIAQGKYVGCRSAGQGCAIDPNNPALACAQTNDLYGCVGGGPNDVVGSCYSNDAAPTCCGCPSWSPDGECKNHYAKWQLPSLPEKYAKVFKDACPTAYSFPYDDPTSTFTCKGTDTQNVSYEITFCP